MRYCDRPHVVVCVACLVALIVGCQKSEQQDEAAIPALGKGAESERPASLPPKPPPPPTIPVVKMTSKLAATCLVKVGDLLPEASLPDLDGKRQSLHELLGERLSVVCFWSSSHPYALEELQDLEIDVAGPYANEGVQVVSINVGDTAEVARKNLPAAGAKFRNLLDPDRAYFGKVATDKLPRTYLLDASGKILWLDTEYSRSTRRDLLQGIQVALGEAGEG